VSHRILTTTLIIIERTVFSVRYKLKFMCNINNYVQKVGYAVAQLVEALCYKPEGRGFYSPWRHWDFSLS